jgi:hypothetical protein
MGRHLVYLAVIVCAGLAGTGWGADPNLVGWWPFDEGSGSVVHDASGNGYDGTITTAVWAEGLNDWSLDFSVGGWVDCPAAAWHTVSKQVTVAFWSYGSFAQPQANFTFGAFIDPADNNARVASCHAPWSDGNVYWDTSGALGVWSPDRINKAATAAEYKGEWRHWTFVKNATTGVQSIYLNGTLWHSATGMTQLMAGDQVTGFSIGNRPMHDSPYSGRIDDFRLYNRALTNAEIKAIAMRPKAYGPSPADGATGVTMPLLQWTAGSTAAFHNVYLGTSPDLTDADLQPRGFGPMLYYGPGFAPGVLYYWRVDEVEGSGTIYTGDVWRFTTAPLTAFDPSPRNGDKWIATDITLTWKAGQGATNHELYFGTDREAVANRDASVSIGTWPTPEHAPAGLAEQTVYYWAVDEVTLTGRNAGEIWSFTTTGPGGGVRGDYFNGMTPEGVPGLTRIDPAIDFAWGDPGGPGAPIGVDQFSARWTADLEIAVADTYVFTTNSDDGSRLWLNDELIVDKWVDQGPTDTSSRTIYLEPGIYPLRMEYYENTGGAVAHLYWQTPTLARAIIPAGALQPPVRARTPYPAKGDVNVPQDVTLRWSAGDEAAQHQVYFGDDAAAVAAADTSSSLYKGTQALDNTSFTPGTLEWNKTYWWRVDEVNDASADSPWVGPVWSFTTADYLVVDDFESYNDEEDKGTRIYETWIDGYTDGLSGSIVGNLDPPFAEQTIVHSGKQAMPMDYNNVNSPYFSEAYRQLAPLQDWTANGVTDLSLWLRGQPIRFQKLAEDDILMSSTSGDVWDVVDHFRYVFKRLTGDGTIVAKVESMTNTAGWAKAGVMIRDSLEPGSMHALEMLAPGGLCAFQNRQFNDEPSYTANGNNGQFTFPHWVKLERKGNQFTAYHSDDGVNWTLQADEAGGGGPNPQTITMSSTVYIGLMVTSNNMNRACVAEFSNIKFTGTVSGSWQTADVGPAIVGNDTAPLYVAVEDSAGKTVTIVHPDPAAVNLTAWTEWKIPLTDLAGVNLAKIKKLYIGVGDKANPTPDGYGRIYLDDIRVTKP